MTGNTFAGSFCVYCPEPATTDDHVFARKFFLEARRGGLPQVPACRACNLAKGKLEDYLMGVLPFAGRHADARENLIRLGAPRIANNLRLQRTLRRGMKPIWVREGGLYQPTSSVPLDWSKLEHLFAYIAKGLAWHHWKVALGVDCFVEAHALVGPIAGTFQKLGRRRAKILVSGDLGNGTFRYIGVRVSESSPATLWEHSIYGGLQSEHGRGTPTNIGVITGRIEGLRRASWRAGRALS